MPKGKKLSDKQRRLLGALGYLGNKASSFGKSLAPLAAAVGGAYIGGKYGRKIGGSISKLRNAKNFKRVMAKAKGRRDAIADNPFISLKHKKQSYRGNKRRIVGGMRQRIAKGQYRGEGYGLVGGYFAGATGAAAAIYKHEKKKEKKRKKR